MKNTLKLDHAKRLVIMDKTFAKFAANTMSAEYAHLQQVRRDYPTYEVVQKRIKKNATKECYRGLTYAYMESYIESHGTAEVRYEFEEMRLIAQCHSKAFRYPTIKAWFLEQFPEVKKFGLKDEDEADAAAPETEDAAAPVEAPTLALVS